MLRQLTQNMRYFTKILDFIVSTLFRSENQNTQLEDTKRQTINVEFLSSTSYIFKKYKNLNATFYEL